jgi:hypothetical protein
MYGTRAKEHFFQIFSSALFLYALLVTETKFHTHTQLQTLFLILIPSFFVLV